MSHQDDPEEPSADDIARVTAATRGFITAGNDLIQAGLDPSLVAFAMMEAAASTALFMFSDGYRTRPTDEQIDCIVRHMREMIENQRAKLSGSTSDAAH